LSDTELAFRTTLDAQGFASGAQQINGHLKDMGIHTQTATANLGPLGTILGTMANPATAAALAITALGSALVGSVQNAAAFETAMSGAKKVISVDDSQASSYFSKLGEDLQLVSTQVPVVATDLAGLAAVGGSLGVASESIAGFAETAAQMSVAFEMPAEEAATSAAKILTAFGQPIDTANMQALGNVVNQIGDSMAATEPEVLDFANRASFLNTTMGLTIPQVAALGGTLISTGLSSEVAATGIKSALNTLTSETSKTGGMDNWAKLMGVGVDELKTKIAGDLPNTLIETANKIAAIEDPVQRFQTAVALAGSEGAVALLKLAGQQDAYNSVLAESISQWDKGQAGESGGMAKTFEANSATFSAQMQILSNAVTYASVAVGNVFLPTLTTAAGGLAGLVVGVTQAAQSFGGIVTGSQAFAALSSVISAVGSVAQAIFGNMQAMFTPIWAAIGQGAGAMSGLQAAFNLLTAPLTIVWTGISTLISGFAAFESAMQPVASTLGGGIATAITAVSEAFSVTSAVMTAFGQSISEVVSESDTIQSLSDAFSTASDAISGVVDAIESTITDMIDWITDQFTSIGDALDITDAAETMTSGALDSVESTLDSYGFGGVLDFMSGVAGKANTILDTEAAAKEQADAAAKAEADRIAENEKLQEAGAEAIEAGKDLAVDSAEDVGKAAGDAISSEIKSGIEAGYSDLETLAIINNSSSSAFEYSSAFGRGSGAKVAQQDGIEYTLSYVGTKVGTDAKLLIDGQEMASGSYTSESAEDIISDLFSQSKATLLDETSLTLQGRTGEAALVSQTDSIKLDYDVLVENYGEQVANRLENQGAVVAAAASQTAVDAYNGLLENMKSPMIENLSEVYDEIAALAAEDPLHASEYQLFGEEFEAKIASQVTDAETFVTSELDGFKSTATSALEDGIIDTDEANSLLGMEDELNYLKEYFPEEFEAIGGNSALALIAALKAGDYEEAGKIIGTEFSSGVETGILGTDMTDVAGSIDLADILADPEEFKETVMDIPDFMENTFQPAIESEIDYFATQWDSGYGKARESATNFMNDMENTAEEMPSLFTERQLSIISDYKNKVIDAGTALAELKEEVSETADEVEEINYAMEESDFEETMFYSSYIGPTSGYYDWLVNKSGRSEDEIRTILINADTVEANTALETLDAKIASARTLKVSVETTGDTDILDLATTNVGGIDWLSTDSTVASTAETTKTIKITADTSDIDSDLTRIESEITTYHTELNEIQTLINPMKVSLDISAAQDTIDEFVREINALSPVVHVTVDIDAYAWEIQDAVENAVIEALANVRA